MIESVCREKGDEEIEKGINGVSYISLRSWKGPLIQGITLRHRFGDGGEAFDPARDPTGRPSPPSADWRLFRESISGRRSVVAWMEQIHSNRVEVVKGFGTGNGYPEGEELFIEGCDGLITDVPDLILMLRVADCVPVFLYDHVKGAVGLFHAGWRGTAAQILPVAVGRMRREYGTRPGDLQVYLGPSIERACYPVGRDVQRQFLQWGENGPDSDGEWRVDLRGVNRRQAIASGIPKDRITISRYCTACSREMFYSYRASGGDSGRMAAFLALRK